MTRRAFVAALSSVMNAQQYSGPRPPKRDVPFLLEARRLLALDVQHATEQKSKHGQILWVPGAASTARTPLPEPIFLIAPDKINPDQLALYHFEVRNGRREASLASHGAEEDQDYQEDLRLTLRKIDLSLYRIEASHMLDPGEYALHAPGADSAFCFAVY